MSSRLARFGKTAIGAAAPAATYLYTHPEAREPVMSTIGEAKNTTVSAVKTAAPYIKSALYIAPSVPRTDEEEIKYLTDFGLALDEAKTKYSSGQRISRSESDNLLKEIFDRATYFATKKGLKTIPTTLSGAEALYNEAQKSYTNKAKEIASSAAATVSSFASGVWSKTPWGKKNESKPLAGGKRKARRSKRSVHGSKRSVHGSKRSRSMRSRRNRSRRNRRN